MTIDLNDEDVKSIMKSNVPDVVKSVIKAQLDIFDDGPTKNICEEYCSRFNIGSSRAKLDMNDMLKRILETGGAFGICANNRDYRGPNFCSKVDTLNKMKSYTFTSYYVHFIDIGEDKVSYFLERGNPEAVKNRIDQINESYKRSLSEQDWSISDDDTNLFKS